MSEELQLLVEFHKDAQRQGPGSTQDTLKALSFIDIKSDKPLKVADIGCGSGGQTITIAQNINANIFAVDLFAEFLEKLNTQAKQLNLQKKITTMTESMENLSFDQEEFDIIWSEGAIYNIGFETGIKNWKKFLKKDGYLAISEITWLTSSRPKEIEEHWNNEYPEIATASKKIHILEENGFSLVGYFYLPEKSWTENYYNPIIDRFDSFLQKYNYSEIAKNIVEAEKKEIELYLKYKKYFSYGFYIAMKL
jgi:cyclopropane fatty-acyl-phospholipid synthase-like methyltransferase